MSNTIYYTIYKITNLLNDKYYIGKHITNNLNDDYMGSGKLIRRAVKKHGKENFKKEILHVFDNEKDMNAKEAELVVISEKTYNLTKGGNGGWYHINSNEELRISKNRKARQSTNKVLQEKYGDDWRSIISSIAAKTNFAKNGVHSNFLKAGKTAFLGKKHSLETKRKIGKANSKNIGEKNSQYGSMWITNGTENKKIKKEDFKFWSNLNWCAGRLMKLEQAAGNAPVLSSLEG